MNTGAEGNRRRSSRRRTPKVEWDSNQSTDDENKTSNSSLRSVGRRTTSKSLYGCSRSSVAGLRKLQKKGQRVKGTDLLAKMNERRNKMSRGKPSSRQKREKDKDEQTASGSSSGFAIPLSILNNIPDIGLCSLEGRTRAASEPSEAGKLSDTVSGSDSSSSSSRPSSRATNSNKKFRKRTISPEVALQNEMNSSGLSIISNNGVNHMPHEGLSSAVLSRALDSCHYDLAHNATKAPILWAHDNMADVLNENTIDSVEKAREILTRWKRVPSTVKTLYTNKAESSGERKTNVLNSKQCSSTQAKKSCNNVAVSPTLFNSKKPTVNTSLSSNLSAPQPPHSNYVSSHTPTPPVTQHGNGVMNAYALTQDDTGSLPTDCSTFWPPHPSTDVSTVSNPTTPLYALTSSSSNHSFIKLLASVPVTISNADGSENGTTRNVGIPIVRMNNPLFPNTPPSFFANQQPIFSPLPNSPPDNRSFSITNILANTLPNNISSSLKMPNTTTLNPNSNAGKKKCRRQSPYRVKTNPPKSLPIRNVNHFNDSKDGKSTSPVQDSNTGSLPMIKQDSVTPLSNNVPNGRHTSSSTTPCSPSNSSQSSIALSSNSSVAVRSAVTTSCPVVPSSLTVVTDEWRRTLEKQLRANEVAKTDRRPSSSSKSKPISPDPLKMTRVLADDRKKRKKSNVLSRFPMKAMTPSTLNDIAVSPLATSPDLPIAMSPMLPQRSPLASPPLNMPFPSPLIGNAFKSPLSGFTPIPVQTPILRANSPVLFASGQFMTANTPSPASTPSMLSGIDLSNKVLLTPEEQGKVDARNYADLERQYWRSLLAFEDQKRIIADLKERLVKARAEQQVLLLGDEKFNHLKEMVVSPVWKPVVPDLLNDLAESSQITSEVRLKGSFDKPILENEDVYKYLLQSLS